MRSLFTLVFVLSFTSLFSQVITTVAGDGSFGYSGDGGPAVNAQLGDLYYTYPAFDNLGNMYITSGDNTIRKVNPAGIITRIAGTPNAIGYTGDGGPAINALLYHPTSITVDNANNIYFVDANADMIRKITPAGIITTVSGQAVITCGFGDGGPLAQARFRAISGLSFDNNNNLYVSDYGCNVIRKVSGASGIVTTIAGNGTIGFSGDGGPATQAQMAYPLSVAVDNAGNVYIPDAQNHRIRKVDVNGIITTIAGTGMFGYSGDGGPALAAKMAFPGSVVIDNTGNLYFGDYNHVIRKINTSGVITTFAGNGTIGYSGDGGPAILAALSITQGKISIDKNNNIYFCDDYHSVVRKISNCTFASITQQPAPVVLCNSGNAQFTLGAAAGAAYQWQVNTGTTWTDLTDNTVYTGSTTATLSLTAATTAMNNYQFRCAVINGCGRNYSSAAVLQVLAPPVPSVTITASSNNICQGTGVTFTAVVPNPGTAPIFQWYQNSTPAGSNSNTYSTNNLSDGDVISCVFSSGYPCLPAASATSNNITMAVLSNQPPILTTTASNNNICAGSAVTFTSSLQNGPASILYEWKLKGTIIPGVTGAIFSTTTLKNNDTVICTLVHSNTCWGNISDTVIMVVSDTTASSIQVSTATPGICQGTSVNFTAVAVNGGSNPQYNWLINGVSAGINSPVFNYASFNNNDVVSCTLASNQFCNTTPLVASNTVAVSVTQPISLVIAAGNYNLCSGSDVTINATAINTVPSTSYQWQKDGINIGSTSLVLQLTNISAANAGDYTVSAGNGVCGTAISLPVTLQVRPTSASLTKDSICQGKTYQFAGNSYNTAGSYDVHLVNSVGCDSLATLQLSVNKTVSIAPLADLVTISNVPVTLNPDVTAINPSYTWEPSLYLNSTDILSPVCTPTQSLQYKLTVTDGGCKDSAFVNVNVLPSLVIPNAFSPNSDGINDTWRINGLAAYSTVHLTVYDRYGRAVFNSYHYNNPWNGNSNTGKPLPVGVYYYVLTTGNTRQPLVGWVSVLR